VGFVPLCDCAPFVVGAEAGLFDRHGLDVELVREVGWASVRDKIAYGQLDAAHALAAMPFAATLGMGSAPCDSVTGLVLNLQGNAVSLSTRFWKEGVRDAESFGAFVRGQRPAGPLVFGIVSPVSSHRLLMQRWLSAAGLVAETDYQFAVVPPPQLPTLVRAGHLAGFCVGEPWNSVAIEQGLAWCPATSADLAPRHVEKVLFVTERFATQRREEHLHLIVALLEACRMCADPSRQKDISALLAERRYVNAPEDLILRSFQGACCSGTGARKEAGPFTVYHDSDSNVPTLERGDWVLKHLIPAQDPELSIQPDGLVRKVFRADLFNAARRLNSHANKNKHPEPNPEPEEAYV